MSKTTLKLLNELKIHYGKLVIVMISIFFISSSMLSFGYTLRMLIDYGIASKDIVALNEAIFHMIIAILVLGIASFFRSFYINYITHEIIANIRIRVYRALLSQPIEYFDKIQTSDCVSRLSHDLMLIGDIITNILSFTIRNIFMMIGGVIMMFIQNIKLSLITIIILPITLILIKFIGKKVRELSTKLYSEKASMEEIIGETLSNIRIVYAFNVNEYRISKLLEQSHKSDLLTSKYLRIRSLFFAMSIFIITSLLLTVIWIGGVDVLDNTISSGNMISFLFFAIATAFSIGGIAEIFGNIQKYFSAAERVFELEEISVLPNKKLIDKNITPKNFKLEIENFSYPSRPDVEIIKNISIEAKAGEFLAIAGPSGSGKSTILQILLGIYKPKICKLSINNKIQDLSSNEFLRTKIAYVPQDPFLFSATIEDNIKLGRDFGPLEEIIEICGLSSMLKQLPKSIDTYIGEKGAQISGGQKQRIALARSLYGNPEILLLDEATSSLDIESENNLLQNLRKFMKDKIIISVAHRISSIIESDKIFLIYDGEVEAVDSHEQLLKNSALYRGLVRG
jgi:ATP-binding cassette subfamily B protein